jgi:hypothetical protein
MNDARFNSLNNELEPYCHIAQVSGSRKWVLALTSHVSYHGCYKDRLKKDAMPDFTLLKDKRCGGDRPTRSDPVPEPSGE